MTDQPLDLDAIRQRAEAATPGPWRKPGGISGHSGRDGEMHPFVIGPNAENPICVMEGDWEDEDADAIFVAAARTDIPALIAEIERLRTVLGDIASLRNDIYKGMDAVMIARAALEGVQRDTAE